jgi:uncharacterized protein (DUF983 family)
MSEDSPAIPCKTCAECGNGYFRLEADVLPNLLVVSGTVVVNEEWSVTGWSGILRCANCGTELPNPELDDIGRESA